MNVEHVLVIDVSGLTKPDLADVDALARLQLAVQRAGWTLRAKHSSEELQSLLELVGLAGVVALPVEVRREPEGGEELGVEEVVESRDPSS